MAAAAAAAAPHIGALPSHVLHHILLTATAHDDVLRFVRFVAACARVCAEWRRVVGGSAAYGLGLPRGRPREDLLAYEGDDDERARVLRRIVERLEREGDALFLSFAHLSDVGAAALGAALQAVPRIRFNALQLSFNELTAAGVTSLAPALRRSWAGHGILDVDVSSNPLGDAGVVALAKALPPTLETLDIANTACGDDGLVALAAALPASQPWSGCAATKTPQAIGAGLPWRARCPPSRRCGSWTSAGQTQQWARRAQRRWRPRCRCARGCGLSLLRVWTIDRARDGARCERRPSDSTASVILLPTAILRPTATSRIRSVRCVMWLRDVNVWSVRA
eukprot:COSAG04_NODE_4028_length_2354_cov_1.941907_2_plen_337_part_00